MNLVQSLKDIQSKITETNLTIHDACAIELAIDYIEEHQDIDTKHENIFGISPKDEIVEESIFEWLDENN